MRNFLARRGRRDRPGALEREADRPELDAEEAAAAEAEERARLEGRDEELLVDARDREQDWEDEDEEEDEEDEEKNGGVGAVGKGARRRARSRVMICDFGLTRQVEAEHNAYYKV